MKSQVSSPTPSHEVAGLVAYVAAHEEQAWEEIRVGHDKPIEEPATP
jgi:hypothetical protein